MPSSGGRSACRRTAAKAGSSASTKQPTTLTAKIVQGKPVDGVRERQRQGVAQHRADRAAQRDRADDRTRGCSGCRELTPAAVLDLT